VQMTPEKLAQSGRARLSAVTVKLNMTNEKRWETRFGAMNERIYRNAVRLFLRGNPNARREKQWE